MVKRIFFGLMCLMLFGLMITAWNLSVRADDTPWLILSLPHMMTSATATTLPSTLSTAIAHGMSPADRPELVASAPPPVEDSGTFILYQHADAQTGQNETEIVTGQFPAFPSVVVHVSCQGTGMIAVQMGNNLYSEVSCPQIDNVNQYSITPSLTLYDTIRITIHGAVAWRVMVVSAK